MLLLCHLQYPRYGDIYGAWAPRERQGQMEHIELSFERPCRVSRIFIFETFNPGQSKFRSKCVCKWSFYVENRSDLVNHRSCCKDFES
jgi:hypothetical protein